MLWDLGLKVGHATRNSDECMRLSRTDMTIRTSILEARYMWGDEALFDGLVERFDEEVVKDTGAEYVQAKLAERDERHAKGGDTRYLVEPNVKEGKGGLRDLHTLFWIGKYFYRVRTAEELVGKGVFTRREYLEFRKAEDFLWAVRCHMHFLTGAGRGAAAFRHPARDRRTARLHQPSGPFGRRALHEALLPDGQDRGRPDAHLLRRAGRGAGQARSRLQPASSSTSRAGGASLPGRAISSSTITASTSSMPDVFERDPVNLIRLFWLADRHGLEFHPEALKLVTRSLKLIDRNLRRDEEANRLFMDILTSTGIRS